MEVESNSRPSEYKSCAAGGVIVLQVPGLVKSGMMACFRDAAVEIGVPNVLVW